MLGFSIVGDRIIIAVAVRSCDRFGASLRISFSHLNLLHQLAQIMHQSMLFLTHQFIIIINQMI